MIHTNRFKSVYSRLFRCTRQGRRDPWGRVARVGHWSRCCRGTRACPSCPGHPWGHGGPVVRGLPKMKQTLVAPGAKHTWTPKKDAPSLKLWGSIFKVYFATYYHHWEVQIFSIGKNVFFFVKFCISKREERFGDPSPQSSWSTNPNLIFGLHVTYVHNFNCILLLRFYHRPGIFLCVIYVHTGGDHLF